MSLHRHGQGGLYLDGFGGNVARPEDEPSRDRDLVWSAATNAPLAIANMIASARTGQFPSLAVEFENYQFVRCTKDRLTSRY